MDQKPSFKDVQIIQRVRDGQTMDQKPSFEDVQTIQWVRDGQTIDQKRHSKTYRQYNGYETDK